MLKIIGLYAYFIYLINFVVIIAIEKNDISSSIVELIVLNVVISVFYAFLVDRFLDVHFRKLRKRYR